ncbi:hypothetical protein BN381_540001 [Candidatus Microthrix parvicella RN1]|uniref:Uncharacterized protein n=1 Tax=Candidatus Neomicrothrix parvicella RN1 TaxID=1229780 RepID=R4Z2A4_9ACTN|nr:hypothetical protein BN381_540001 [Candidatus Microthrix parvicella RN1]
MSSQDPAFRSYLGFLGVRAVESVDTKGFSFRESQKRIDTRLTL